ncbi:MAG: L-lactate dehydrogenase [Clostridia bacterium]|nr:L-lactate dehydrogenase [Clostridia bacterium]
MNKITIIGAGSVGATVAYTLAIQGVASEIVLIDINKEKAFGEALDIYQGTPYSHSCLVSEGDYADAAGSDIVVVTSGVARKPGQSRLDLAQTNVNIIKSIAPQIVKHAPDAIYVIVSNPVDVLTYAFCKYSGLPEKQIIGSGTILDTSRLRAYLSEFYEMNQVNVHAYVLGEHGDSSFVPWSLANISNIPIDIYPWALADDTNFPVLDKAAALEHVKKSGGKVIQSKGATYYAVSMSVCHICKCILTGIDTALTVSTMLHGEYGIDDVCLSLLNIVGKKGVSSKIILPLTPDEVEALKASAKNLKDVINSIEF